MKKLLLSFVFSLVITFAYPQRSKTSSLDIKVDLKVHPQEILESVIFRLNEVTGNIAYSSVTLAPYSAKVKNYKNVTVRVILDDQLQGTNLAYKLKGNKISIVSSLNAKAQKD